MSEIQFFLGNDLAGDKVMGNTPSPILKSEPRAYKVWLSKKSVEANVCVLLLKLEEVKELSDQIEGSV